MNHDKRRYMSLLAAGIMLATAGAATAQNTAFGQPPTDDQDRIAREMVEVLKAYAVYKVGDFEEAFRRYEVLAEKGNVQGMTNLANMYQAGEGTAVDKARALHWYRKAAATGDTNAMIELGAAHRDGIGTPVDQGAADRWFRKAAEAGDADGQWLLGSRVYERGEQAAGLSWIRRASNEASHPAAQRFLARLRDTSDKAPSTKRREAVLETIAAIDRAARSKKAAGVVEPIEQGADIQVRLPNSRSWTTLDRSAFAALWRDSFDGAEAYVFERSEPTLTVVDAGVEVASTIRERLGPADRPRWLAIDETAIIRFKDETPRIQRLRLDMRACEAACTNAVEPTTN